MTIKLQTDREQARAPDKGVLSVFLYLKSIKGNDGDSVSKKPTERCGHRLRAASGRQETIGNTPEPDG